MAGSYRTQTAHRTRSRIEGKTANSFPPETHDSLSYIFRQVHKPLTSTALLLVPVGISPPYRLIHARPREAKSAEIFSGVFLLSFLFFFLLLLLA